MIALTDSLSFRMRNMAILSAIMVVALHCVSRLHVCDVVIRFGLYDGVFRVAVPYFFFASGFFLAAHDIDRLETYRHELLKRLKSLFVPLIVWSVSFWMYSCCLTRFPTQMGFSDALTVLGLHPLRLPALSTLWFLRGLLVLVAFSPLIKMLANPIGLCALFAVYALLAPWELFNLKTFYLFRRLIPLHGLFYFALGMAFHLDRIKFREIGWKPSFGLFLLGITLLMIKVALREVPYIYYLGMVSVPLLMYSIFNLLPAYKLPSWLYGLIFPLFLIHRFILLPFQLCFDRICACQYAVIFLLVLAISIGVILLQRRFLPSLNQLLYGGR